MFNADNTKSVPIYHIPAGNSEMNQIRYDEAVKKQLEYDVSRFNNDPFAHLIRVWNECFKKQYNKNTSLHLINENCSYYANIEKHITGNYNNPKAHIAVLIAQMILYRIKTLVCPSMLYYENIIHYASTVFCLINIHKIQLDYYTLKLFMRTVSEITPLCYRHGLTRLEQSFPNPQEEQLVNDTFNDFYHNLLTKDNRSSPAERLSFIHALLLRYIHKSARSQQTHKNMTQGLNMLKKATNFIKQYEYFIQTDIHHICQFESKNSKTIVEFIRQDINAMINMIKMCSFSENHNNTENSASENYQFLSDFYRKIINASRQFFYQHETQPLPPIPEDSTKTNRTSHTVKTPQNTYFLHTTLPSYTQALSLSAPKEYSSSSAHAGGALAKGPQSPPQSTQTIQKK